jgi:hypothetical protein
MVLFVCKINLTKKEEVFAKSLLFFLFFYLFPRTTVIIKLPHFQIAHFEAELYEHASSFHFQIVSFSNYPMSASAIFQFPNSFIFSF